VLHGGGKAPETARDPNTHLAGNCSIGFNVENLAQTYELLSARGVTFVTPPAALEGGNLKVAIALDPDGFPVSFGESPKK
jgi:hypothetical protein